MSNTKSWKKARRIARGISRDVEEEQRALRRIPHWRMELAHFGLKGFTLRWTKRWEERQKRALRKALKVTTHRLHDIGGRAYHMKPVAKLEAKP
jgi:hypothetical protein